MINVNMSKKGIMLEVSGGIAEICSDLTTIISSIVENMDEEAANHFKFVFTKGFDDGIVFGIKKKEMDEIREQLKKQLGDKSVDELREAMEGLRDLKKKLEELLTEDEDNKDADK